ncbi:MAG: Flp pilus assembly protein CpaB [Acidobacteriaceae bacterium]
MKAKRLLIALLFALVVSGLFTFWLSGRVAKANHTAAPQKQLYVAAGKPLDAGEQLKPANLQLMPWPASTPLTGGFSKMDEVAGRVVLYPLPKGEPILERQLAAPGAGAGLTAKIPTGMRAISVRSDEVVGVAGFLLPGTHVDVLMTYHSVAAPESQTLTVLQDVVVLAAGQQIQPQADGKPISVNVVTLLLKPEDAEKLVLATSLGGIYFVLRNGGDQEQAENQPIGLAQLTGNAAVPAVHGVGATSKPMHPKPKPYEVETILGDKQVFNGFH